MNVFRKFKVCTFNNGKISLNANTFSPPFHHFAIYDRHFIRPALYNNYTPFVLRSHYFCHAANDKQTEDVRRQMRRMFKTNPV